VPGWKAFAPITAPLSRASHEGEGVMKKINKRKKKNRTILCVFIGFEVFIAFSGNSIKTLDTCTDYN
jgi:hypothetical protein